MAVETWAQTPVRAIFLFLTSAQQQISTVDILRIFNYNFKGLNFDKMDSNLKGTLLPKIVKGLGLGALALVGIGGGIAYANYRS